MLLQKLLRKDICCSRGTERFFSKGVGGAYLFIKFVCSLPSGASRTKPTSQNFINCPATDLPVFRQIRTTSPEIYLPRYLNELTLGLLGIFRKLYSRCAKMRLSIGRPVSGRTYRIPTRSPLFHADKCQPQFLFENNIPSMEQMKLCQIVT